jgi:Glycosyltransferase family 87
MLAGGIALVDRRPILAGVLFGPLTYKPHLGLLIPVALIAGGYWRTFIVAAVTAVVFALASGWVLGWDAWASFLANAHIHRGLLEANPGMWPRMPTVYLAGRWLGVLSPFAYALQTISALAAATAVFVVWRRSAPLPVRASALIAGTFLATPYAWDYDLVVIAVAVVWYWSQASADGWRRGEKAMLATLLLAPAFTPWLALYAHLQIAPIAYGLALALIVRRALAYPAGRRSSAG